MKNKIKSIVGNGLPYGITFFGLSFMIGYFFHVDLQQTLEMSVFLGIAALLINGFIYSRFSKPIKSLNEISVSLNNSELLLLQSPANYLIEDSLVPGKLFLTDLRLIFKSYEKETISQKEHFWNINSITPVDFSWSLWNSGGEFILRSESQNRLMFEVDKIKIWKTHLSK